MSDLHYRSDLFPGSRLAAVLDALRGFAPDVLLFGGDTVFDAETLAEIPPLLARFAAVAPCRCAVTGNWEQGKVWIPKSEWREIFGSGGVKLLLNDFCRLPWLDLYGGEDPAHGEPAWPAADRWREGTVRIFFTHRPDTAVLAECSGCGFHGAFAGHTHGGQWRLPFFGALCTHSLYGRRFDSGVFFRRGGERWLIVGRGLGEGGRAGRLFCRRELVLAEFDADAAPGKEGGR